MKEKEREIQDITAGDKYEPRPIKPINNKDIKIVFRSRLNERVPPRSGLDCTPLQLMPRQALSSGVELEPVKWDLSSPPPVLSWSFCKEDKEFGRDGGWSLLCEL